MKATYRSRFVRPVMPIHARDGRRMRIASASTAGDIHALPRWQPVYFYDECMVTSSTRKLEPMSIVPWIFLGAVTTAPLPAIVVTVATPATVSIIYGFATIVASLELHLLPTYRAGENPFPLSSSELGGLVRGGVRTRIKIMTFFAHGFSPFFERL